LRLDLRQRMSDTSSGRNTVVMRLQIRALLPWLAFLLVIYAVYWLESAHRVGDASGVANWN
jgi:1,4-dihydroxy-2-naphthoate octaprenyltransferase